MPNPGQLKRLLAVVPLLAAGLALAPAAGAAIVYYAPTGLGGYANDPSLISEASAVVPGTPLQQWTLDGRYTATVMPPPPGPPNTVAVMAATLQVYLNGNWVSDLATVGGSVLYDENGFYQDLNYSNPETVSLSIVGAVAGGSTVTLKLSVQGDANFYLTVGNPDGTQLTLEATPLPEPASALLVLAGGLSCLCRRRRAQVHD